MHSYIIIVAFHLDTLDMQNMDVQHAVLELNHKMVSVDILAQGRKGLRPKIILTLT